MRALAAGALMVAAAPAAAQSPFTQVTDPAERALLPEASELLSAPSPDLARLDALLARLPRPLPLRGLVQLRRAELLAKASRSTEAMAALEEALRLLPDDSRAKIMASHMLVFMGAPERAADLWMAASREQPRMALNSHPYVLSAMEGRLRDMGDHRRADALRARMAEIGFARSLAPERAKTALAAVRVAFTTGGAAAAEPLLSQINSPDGMRPLYLDRRYQVLWPAIEERAGRNLAGLQATFVGEVRREWTDADDFTTATNYARVLARARAYSAVVALFKPALDTSTATDEHEGTPFLVPVVARALANLGRFDEAGALIDKAKASWPKESPGLGLNFDAARLRLAVARRQWSEVERRATDFLAAATRLGPEINADAMMTVKTVRVCALHRLGRDAEGAVDAADVIAARSRMPDAAMDLYACTGDRDKARALLIASLADEDQRGFALDYLQPPGPPEIEETPEELAFAARLRADPAVRAKAEAVGRLLPMPIARELPPGFDPLAPAGKMPIGPGVT